MYGPPCAHFPHHSKFYVLYSLWWILEKSDVNARDLNYGTITFRNVLFFLCIGEATSASIRFGYKYLRDLRKRSRFWRIFNKFAGFLLTVFLVSCNRWPMFQFPQPWQRPHSTIRYQNQFQLPTSFLMSSRFHTT